jgi:N-acetyl-anhydromuramyl-L-alanine amidase AmpD
MFPKIKCDYPRDASGKLIPRKLDNEVLESYEGVLGHFHIQRNKVDPGPALQWDRLIDGARRLMQERDAHPSPTDTSLGHMRPRN